MKRVISKFKGLFTFSRELGENPTFDWHFGIACFVILLALIVAIDSYMFVKFSKEQQSTDTSALESSGGIVINRDNIRKAILNIKEKDNSDDTLHETVLRDPSL